MGNMIQYVCYGRKVEVRDNGKYIQYLYDGLGVRKVISERDFPCL